MRTLKFRAWHKERKVMCHFDMKTITKTPYPGFYYTDDLDGFYCELDDPNLYTDLMQYTGLKDKNGKEIYEGDIVQSTSNFVCWETGIETGKICIETHQIIYVEEEALFTTQAIKALSQVGYVNKLGMSQKQMDKYYEVIGNIYENPELQEERK